MAVTAYMYGQALMKALNKEIDWDTDTIKVSLLTNTYTPNQDTHEHYTRQAWAGGVAYAVGDYVRPTTKNGHVYKCTTAGTTGTTEPTWTTTAGGTNTDGTVTWTEDGIRDVSYFETSGTGYTAGGTALASKTMTYDGATNKIILDAADVTWASSTITARYAVIYDDTPADAKALLGYVDFGVDESSSNGDFTITWATGGIINITAS